jgi:arsenite methyltransferase
MKNIKTMVKKRYGEIAKASSSCCCSCDCGSGNDAKKQSGKVGYSKKEMDAVPNGSNLGLGCGNPTALASIRKGETILDLGAGAGFDCFLAANETGPKGRVIGIDMTPEMIKKARENAKKGGYKNVDFRMGEIEKLPVEDKSVDLIISNCVINLSPEKQKVFNEAFRVLKPGGRLMVSDLVLNGRLPEKVRKSAAAYYGCVAGAEQKKEYLRKIEKAGFKQVKVKAEARFTMDIFEKSGIAEAEAGLTREDIVKAVKCVLSMEVSAVKPG